MTTTYLLLAALLLLLANAFFVAGEFAIVASRREQIEQLAREGNKRAKTALSSARELSFMLAAAQLGITMASLGLGFVGEPSVAHLLEIAVEPFHLPPALLHSVSFVVALAIISFLHMVVGEMAPKNIAIAQPVKTALWLSVPFRLYANLFRPFIAALNAIANAGLRLLKVEPTDELMAAHSIEELGAMISETAKGGGIDRFEHQLLSGVVAFGKRDAGSAMVPRTDVVAVPVDITTEELARIIVETQHSRLPVYDGDLDHVVGFFHSKDLLRLRAEGRGKTLSPAYIRQMLVVPESRKLHPLLRDMRRARQHFALVVDEHGGTAGVITLEDVLEELVGEIRDEYDEREGGIERLGDRVFIVPGTLRVDEASAQLSVELPDGPYETIAGFLMDRLGRIPRRRDVVAHDGWLLRVLSMHRRRVLRVLIQRHPASGRAERAEHAELAELDERQHSARG